MIETDKRILKAFDRLKSLTIVGEGVSGGWDTGYAIRRERAPAAEVVEPCGVCSLSQVAVTGIEFECCAPLALGSGIITDISVNGSTNDMEPVEPSEDCTESDPTVCVFQNLEPFPETHIQNYSDPDCEVPSGVGSDGGILIYAVRFECLWNVMIVAFAPRFIIFWGTGGTIGAPIANLLDCEGFPYTIPDEFLNCTGFGLPGNNFKAMARGGTVTLT